MKKHEFKCAECGDQQPCKTMICGSPDAPDGCVYDDDDDYRATASWREITPTNDAGCPGCKEKGEEIERLEEYAKHERDVSKALDEECREKSKEIERLKKEVDVLTDVHSNMRTELRNVYGEIERLKERNLELHDSICDALSGKLSGEGITFDGWPLSYWREMKGQNERLETAMTNLESQQESDTETAGILADVVDILFEEDDRCERLGYTNVKARAEFVIKRNHDLRKGFEDLDGENGVLRAERDALNDAIKKGAEFHREVIVIKDETIKSERSKNAGIADNIAAIKKTLDKLAKKKK